MPRPKSTSHRDLLLLWSSLDALAEGLGISRNTVAAWKRRQSVPQVWWQPVADVAKAHGIRGASYACFKRIAEDRRRPTENLNE